MEQFRLKSDFERFQIAISTLADTNGKLRQLSNSHGRLDWPTRGVYIFLGGNGEGDSNVSRRVVRIGTHAVSSGSKTTLWNRLSQHRGNLKDGGGNHRGSIFRKRVGQALIQRDNLQLESWGFGNNAPREIREAEKPIEELVSEVIGEMPFVFLEIDDEPSKTSMRSFIEKNSISLVSQFNFHFGYGDANWLGKYTNIEEIVKSGLWNSNYVGEDYDPAFLSVLERLIEEQL